ncbi:SSI family serine proteinase inhibitor [Kitasatospora sp. NPDC059571]|uniref:SSI family serine proteinase inhibitor n=1 Tax=Kitasatospora sp. NPDC059571 TaxID=3346871 RepID=UPI0036A715AF
MRPIAGAAAAALALLLLPVPPAASARAVPSRLVLSAGERRTELLCSGVPGGGHPAAARACAELAAAGGDLDRLPRGSALCPMVYQPVTAAADGLWDGRRVHWSQEFANACILRRATGTVFAF